MCSSSAFACLLTLQLCVQLIERRQGNMHYDKRHFTAALEHYSKAASMLEVIKGRAAEEQQEVDANLGKVYLNIAAVHLQQQYYGEATMWCTKALKLDGSNDKALLRRAKAHMGRHNYQVNSELTNLLLCKSMHHYASCSAVTWLCWGMLRPVLIVSDTIR